MSHHSIIFTCKGNVAIPEEHKRALNDFANYSGVSLRIDQTRISFSCGGFYWSYLDDIEDLIEENELTFGMLEAYQWLKENTNVESGCWNPCDAEYGPDCWDDIERELYCLSDRSKDTIKKLKGSLCDESQINVIASKTLSPKESDE